MPSQVDQELETLIRARYPLIYVVSWEERRVEEALRTISSNRGKRMWVWSVTQGLVNSPTGKDTKTRAPMAALDVIEACPYTTVLQVRQELGLPWLPAPKLEVRVYHDARMAEVVGAEQARRLLAIYPYPNQAMHQPDEKNQLNQFLGEWLSHCLACGHELEPVVL